MVKSLNVKTACYHCGSICEDDSVKSDNKNFCCVGCKTVYEILQENNLCTYYDLNQNAGVSLKAKDFKGKYDFLSSIDIEKQILDYNSPNLAKVTLYIPSIHCSSCVWLLENFSKVHDGITYSRLNFIKKELAISYNPAETSLKGIVELLATLGYAPLINLESADKPHQNRKKEHNKLLMRIGLVGFATGNIMLLSFPEYLKLNVQNAEDAGFQKLFLYLNFILALPVYFFGAWDYLKSAWISIREKIKGTTDIITVDVPIALGITALFVRSLYETFINHSAGYWDSLAGLVFLLLIGKYLQQVTYNYLSFERDYKSYFPLAVKVKAKGYKNVSQLERKDIIEIHNHELIPADSILLSENALVDYSFVTGESDPVKILKGETIFAGGRQLGAKIDLFVEKSTSQSYLTSLWNHESFEKKKQSKTSRFADLFSKYFTYAVISLAAVTGLFWYFTDSSLVWNTVTAVLIVACPCALTLGMPYTMNTAMSILGKNKFFVKNQNVIQLMSEVDTIIFDKTGTLTRSRSGDVELTYNLLNEEEKKLIKTACMQSVHPLSKQIAEYLSAYRNDYKVSFFEEIKGRGFTTVVNGKTLKVGNSSFLKLENLSQKSGQVSISIDGVYKATFIIKSSFRSGWESLLTSLKSKFELYLLSGDNNKDQATVQPYFDKTNLHFNLKPHDKLAFVTRLQEQHDKKVLMIGDGLNDAGALSQSHVGIALSEDVNAFSPSCDAIMDAGEFNRLDTFINYSKAAMNTVRYGFILSMFYNVIGLGLAVTGILKPLYAAIFMPFSNITVVLFSVGLTYLYAKFRKLI